MSKKNKKNDEYEDISSYSKPERKKNNIFVSFLSFFAVHKAFLSIFLCVAIMVSSLGGAVLVKNADEILGFLNIFSLINQSDGHFGNSDAVFDDYEMDENLNFATISDIEDANSIKELLKAWATNGGEHIHSKKVINILLVGEDDEDGTHRSDSTMLVSVNTKTKKITITSFLRDSYTYMTIIDQERYCKTNHSYGWGGAAKLMEVLSNNYKIEIDQYVSINYQSFKNAINALGGVRVPITEAEARYMNRTTKVKGFTSGDSVLLNGEQALIYARIRKLDSEVERTRRQRELISSVIKSVKASSLSDIYTAIETFLPYVTTNIKTGEIISYGTQALREGWMDYEIISMVEPSEELRYGVRGFRTYSGYLDVWIVDYIKAARELQLALYGQTNIEIDPETHVSAIDLAMGTSKTSGDSDYNDDEEYDDDNEEETTTRRYRPENWFNKDDEDEEQTSLFPTLTLPDITLIGRDEELSDPDSEPKTDESEEYSSDYETSQNDLNE